MEVCEELCSRVHISLFLQVLLSKIEKQKPKMDNLMQKAENVVDNNSNDSGVQTDVNKVIEPVLENMESAKLRLKKRREKLQRLFTKQSKIDDAIESYSDRLKDVEKRQEQQRPISAVLEIVTRQRSDSDEIVANVTDLRVGYKDVERKVHEFVDKEQGQEETDRIIESFEKVKLRYENVKEEGTVKAKKTHEVETSARIHNDRVIEFIAWLSTAEKKFRDNERKGIESRDSKETVKKSKGVLKVCF